VKAALTFLYRSTPAWATRLLLRGLNPTFSLGVAGVFRDRDGRVLVQRHVYRHAYPWGLPSGFLAAGETPEDGALRELHEETGLAAAVEGVIGCYFIHPRHLEIAVGGTIDSAQIPRLSHEIFEVAFVAPDRLPAAMPPDQKAMVARAGLGLAAIKTLSR
jgi:ADP-ribose pyrophosphatase YjhB (NUDIX family)